MVQPVADAALAVIGKHFNLTEEILLNYSRIDAYFWPRCMAIYLTRKISGCGYIALAQVFKRNSHTVARWACKYVLSQLSTEKKALSKELGGYETEILKVLNRNT